MEGGEVFGRLLPALLLVVATPLVLRYFLRRSRGLAGGAVRVVARAPMGRSSSAVVVAAGKRHFLLGVTDTSVRLISELDPADEVDIYSGSGTDAREQQSNWPRIGLDRWRQMTLRRPPKEQIRVLVE